ncbi:MAG: NTP transferase domain-containing protein [Chryseolinea sp.]
MEKNIKQKSLSPVLFGLILAGGKSSRMGFDKGSIDYHGQPQREYLFDLLGKYCSQVFTSCKNANDIPKTLNPLPDQFQINSPLNGILSAFQFNKDVAWLTIPVDMPLIDGAVIEFLIKHRDPSKTATCFFDSDGKNPEPLFTLWEPLAWDGLQKFHHSEKISPRDFLKQSEITILSVPNNRYLTNINSEEEWKQFKRDQNQFS